MSPFLVVLLALPLAPAAEPGLDPALPYQAKRSNAVAYDVDFRVIVTAPQGTKMLRVWVPVPQDDVGQKVEESRFEVFPNPVKPALHTEKVFGNTFAYFEIANPQGAQIIAHTFKATVWELNWGVDPAKVVKVTDWPATFVPYRRAESQILIDDRVTKLAGEVTAGKAGPAAETAAIMDWIQANLTYDHSNTSLVASTAHALAQKRGDCSDYHGLCSSMARALGVPTRVTYGLHLFAKNLPVHCKCEVFLPPYGWVSFDVSETQRLVKAIQAAPDLDAAGKAKLVQAALGRMRGGFRDNSWLLQTKGTDYDLAPPASKKVPLIATIYAEADGQALPAPDPADPTKKEFAWMTAHKYTPDRPVPYPFRDLRTLGR